MSLITYLAIATGGATGACLRYITTNALQKHFSTFPIGTLACNVIGSFLLGLLLFTAEATHPHKDIIALLGIGLLGAYTTMSTFSYETMSLFSDLHNNLALLNILITLILTIGSIYLAKIIVTSLKAGSLA